MTNKIKIYLLKTTYKYWAVFSRFWYSLTMRATRRNYELKTVDSPEQIPVLFDYGSKYLKDPLDGKFDYLAHPSLLEKRLESGQQFGDCDDHAIYYASKLIKSGLADKAWFAYYTMSDPTGSNLASHAVCVYEKDGQSFWADYRAPRKVKSVWDFAEQSAEIYNKRAVAACMFEIQLKSCDTPVFTNSRVKTDYSISSNDGREQK